MDLLATALSSERDLIDKLPNDLIRLLDRALIAQEASGVGVYDYDIPNDSIYWDKRTRSFWGVDDNVIITYGVFARSLHPDDLPAVDAAVAHAADPTGDGRYFAEFRVINAQDQSIRTIEANGRTTFVDGKAAKLIGTVRDVSAERAAQAELAKAQQFTQNLIDTAPTVLYVYDLVEKKNVFIGPQIDPITGMTRHEYKELSNGLISAVIHPEDLERVLIHHADIRSGLLQPPFEIEYRLRATNGTWVWMAATEVVHARDADGLPTQIIGASLDITQRKQAEETRDLLILELVHRAKNTFSIIQSIASMTLSKHCDQLAWHAFESRLHALASAQDVLRATQWQKASISAIADKTLAPFSDAYANRILVSGPEVEVTSQAVVPLTLVLHELATNAAKYGALTGEQGAVKVQWSVHDQAICLLWAEEGGPAVSKPSGTGFGSRMIRSALGAVQGKAVLEFAPEGVRCEVTLKSAC